MTKTNKLFAMAMAAAMITGTFSTMSAFAQDASEDPDKFYEWTETDITLTSVNIDDIKEISSIEISL